MLNNYVFLLFNLKLLQIYLYKCEKKFSCCLLNINRWNNDAQLDQLMSSDILELANKTPFS